MNDIVERLRLNAGHYTTSVASERLMHEAAAEIERLRNERAEYDSCQCTGFHTHHHGICTTCKKPVISWQEAHKTAAEEAEMYRTELSTAKALLREADAELASWMYYGHGSKTSGYGSAALLNRISAALGDDPTS